MKSCNRQNLKFQLSICFCNSFLFIFNAARSRCFQPTFSSFSDIVSANILLILRHCISQYSPHSPTLYQPIFSTFSDIVSANILLILRHRISQYSPHSPTPSGVPMFVMPVPDFDIEQNCLVNNPHSSLSENENLHLYDTVSSSLNETIPLKTFSNKENAQESTNKVEIVDNTAESFAEDEDEDEQNDQMRQKLTNSVHNHATEAYQKFREKIFGESAEAAHEEIEMMDYDTAEEHISSQRYPEGEKEPASRILRLTVFRIAITLIVGIVLGLTGFALSNAVSILITANVSILTSMLNQNRLVGAFFSILMISMSYTLLAALMVTFGSWQIRGSGVGRLNAYLSGMYSSRFLTLRTLILKMAGLILTISAGIKQGLEGPFIHIGAMLGLQVSRCCLGLSDVLFNRFGIKSYTRVLRGVVDERLFITGGAAAGFSVAFNAPVAGVLYVMDGAFAYWSGEYTLRTFICTMTAVTTLNLCYINNQVLPSRGLIDLNLPSTSKITIQEFWGFAVLGVIGGVLGFIFTKLNLVVERLRLRHLGRKRLYNVLDVIVWTIITVLIAFVLPFLFPCTAKGAICSTYPDRCLRYQCGPQKYSSLATLFFALPEQSLRMLFDRSLSPDAQIHFSVLVVFVVVYFLLAALSYNMAVPGGLFIPSIIIGGAFGRLVGLLMQVAVDEPAGDPELGINPGVYAVLGAASMLGGITRMTLPITVMMIEITSDAQFLIPIMLVVVIAKGVADRLIGGLYSEHLKLDGLHMVFGDRLPRELKGATARDLMSKPPLLTFTIVDRVSNLYDMLKNTKHHAFPVIDCSHTTLRRRSRLLRNRKVNTIRDELNAEEQKDPRMHVGVYVGLLKRQQLFNILSSMPCYPSAAMARESEILTAELVNDPLQDAIGKQKTKRTFIHGDLNDRHTRLDSDDRSRTISRSQSYYIERGQHLPAMSPQIAHALVLEAIDSPYSSLLNQTALGKPAKIVSQPIATGHSSHDDSNLHVQSSMLDHWINISKFLDYGSHVVLEDTSARRVWALFRSLGMRHIVVLDLNHRPVGIITRNDVMWFIAAQ